LNFLAQAWNFKFSLLPVVLTYAIFEIPAWIRRYNRWLYTPIYFIFFPLGQSDQLYAQYFNEDDYYRVGVSQTPAEKAALRRHIISISILSMIASTVIAPIVCGFLSALYLTQDQFIEFVGFLMIVKTLTLIWSLYKVWSVSFINESKSFLGVVALYVIYLFFIWRLLMMVHDWTASRVGSLGVFGMLWALSDHILIDVLLNVVIVSAGTWALVLFFTRPKYIHRRP
jgi:hypothetical protein